MVLASQNFQVTQQNPHVEQSTKGENLLRFQRIYISTIEEIFI